MTRVGERVAPSRGQARALLIAGILPVLAFTLIEEYFGTLWGLVAGMVFGVGEILHEWRTQGRVDPITWGGNGMLLVLGGISLVTQEGIFFKLQPALLEAAMAVALWGSVWADRPLLLALARKQLPAGRFPGGVLPPALLSALRGMTWRLGAFFALHAGVAAWAAFRWSTEAWAVLKGVGFTLSLVAYMAGEGWILRRRAVRGVTPEKSEEKKV